MAAARRHWPIRVIRGIHVLGYRCTEWGHGISCPTSRASALAGSSGLFNDVPPVAVQGGSRSRLLQDVFICAAVYYALTMLAGACTSPPGQLANAVHALGIFLGVALSY